MTTEEPPPPNRHAPIIFKPRAEHPQQCGVHLDGFADLKDVVLRLDNSISCFYASMDMFDTAREKLDAFRKQLSECHSYDVLNLFEKVVEWHDIITKRATNDRETGMTLLRIADVEGMCFATKPCFVVSRVWKNVLDEPSDEIMSLVTCAGLWAGLSKYERVDFELAECTCGDPPLWQCILRDFAYMKS